MTAHRVVDLWVRCDGVVHWCDVTVAERGNPSYLVLSQSQSGFAAKRAEGQKRAKWDKLAPPGVVFQPLAFESTGHVGKAVSKFLQAMEKMSSSPPAGGADGAIIHLMYSLWGGDGQGGRAKALLPRG